MLHSCRRAAGRVARCVSEACSLSVQAPASRAWREHAVAARDFTSQPHRSGMSATTVLCVRKDGQARSGAKAWHHVLSRSFHIAHPRPTHRRSRRLL